MTQAELLPRDRLEEQLDDPQTRKALSALLEHTDLLVFGVESVNGFLSRSEVILDNVTQSVKEVANAAGSQRQELLAHAPALLNVLAQNSDDVGIA